MKLKKGNKWFKREIFARFLSVKELEKLEEKYNQAKIVSLGRAAVSSGA